MHYNVAIIGAGPAGLAAAAVLARAGHQVVLIDPLQGNTTAPVFPCKVGESLPAAFANLLHKLAFKPLNRTLHQPIPGSQSLWAGEFLVQDFIMQAQGEGWRLDRLAFEKQLREQVIALGVRHHAASLHNASLQNIHWQLSCSDGTNIQSDFLIDASGRRAVLSRLFSIPRNKDVPLVALWCVGDLPEESRERTRQTLIESQDEGWWYAAYLPCGRPLAVFHTSAGQAAALRRNSTRWLDQLESTQLIKTEVSPRFFARGALNVSEARTAYAQQVYGKQWALCGDAALSFDPLSSQGIFNAMATADMLCQSLLKQLTIETCSDLTSYQQKLIRITKIYQQQRHAFYQRAYHFHRSAFWSEQSASSYNQHL